MDIKDLYSSSKHIVSTRLSSKLIGSILLSFIAFNWRGIFIILFSNKPIEYRIIYTDLNYSDYILHLLAPITTGLLLYILLPYITEWFEKKIQKAKDSKNERIIKDYDQEVKVAMRQFEIQQARTGTKDLSLLKSQIEEKENYIEELTKNNNSLQERINKLTLEASVLNNKYKNYYDSFDKINTKSFRTFISFINNKNISEFCESVTKVGFNQAINKLNNESISNLLYFGIIRISPKNQKEIEFTILGELILESRKTIPILEKLLLDNKEPF